MTAAVNVQTAIYGALNGDTGVSNLVQAIYDFAPQDEISGDSDFPYIVIGEDTVAPWDTDDSTGAEWTVTVHSWSRYRGQKEIKQIQDACYDVLHRAALSVTDFVTVTVEWEFGETLLDPDGLTHHGVQRYRLLLQESH